MSYTNYKGALKEYGEIGAYSGVLAASPHRLIQMLMEGAIDKISIAKGHMLRGNISEKGAHISWAISIIDGLRMSLDKVAGGDIAQNLEDLYNYMERRLLQANLENNPAMLDEVNSLMNEIKLAWDAIPESERTPNNQQDQGSDSESA